MNYHYIEFMIKERRREEMERSTRLRMLKQAGYTHTGFTEKMVIAFSQLLSSWNTLKRLMHRSPGNLSVHRFFPVKPEE